MGRKLGFSWSWRRATGLSAAKGKLSRKLGIPLTKSGRERKAGRMIFGLFLPTPERKKGATAPKSAKSSPDAASSPRRKGEKRSNFLVSGTNHEGRAKLIAGSGLGVGDAVQLAREPENPADENAVAVLLTDGRRIGYVPAEDAPRVAGCLDAGQHCSARVAKFYEGKSHPIPVILARFASEPLEDEPEEAEDAPEPAGLGRKLLGLVVVIVLGLMALGILRSVLWPRGR